MAPGAGGRELDGSVSGSGVVKPGMAEMRSSVLAGPVAPEASGGGGTMSSDDGGAEQSSIPEDFDCYVRAHTGRLLRMARLLTRDAHDAEDLVQETLVRLHRNWSRVQAARTPVAYVRRVMVNAHLDAVRRRHGGDVDELDGANGIVPAQLRQPDHSGRVNETIDVSRALDRLAPRQRTAVVLRYYLRLSTPEVAAAMDVEVSTARSTLTRALAQLHRQLDHWNEEN